MSTGFKMRWTIWCVTRQTFFHFRCIYTPQHSITAWWNFLFCSQFECCGYNDYNDYKNNTILILPLTCCKSFKHNDVNHICPVENCHKIGCKEAFLNILKRNRSIIIGVVVVFALIEVSEINWQKLLQYSVLYLLTLFSFVTLSSSALSSHAFYSPEKTEPRTIDTRFNWFYRTKLERKPKIARK